VKKYASSSSMNLRRKKIIVAAGVCAVALLHIVAANAAGDSDLAKYVDPFIGTEPSPGSQFGIAFDTGNVFPGAVAPRGMLAWSPDTTSANKIAGGYWYPDSAIEGFSLTHFSGRGVCCLKDIPFLPVVVPVTKSPGTNFSPFAASFSHKNESVSPGFYQVRLDNGVEAALTASPRAGVARFVFPGNSPAGLLIRADGAVAINGREVSGFHDTSIDGGRRSKPPYKLYFVAAVDQPFTSRVWLRDELKVAASANGNNCGAILNFDSAKNRKVNVRVGISYVSIENARANLAAASHLGFSANLFTVATDTVPKHAVSSVAGIGGMAAAVGGMFIAKLVGFVLDTTHSYVIPFAIAACVYLVAVGILHLLLPKLELMKLEKA
jgi:putative alpha-1,2-mannosidase